MKKPTVHPPHLFLRFFRWFCHPRLAPYIEGDLLELYAQRVTEGGKRSADVQFIVDVVLLFRPGIIKPTKGFHRLTNYGMFQNYFKVAIRNLIKHPSYVLINTLGMGLALTCCMTAYLLLAYDLEFDHSLDQEKVKNIVKVMEHIEQTNGETYQQLVAPLALAPMAAQDIAGIQHFSRYCSERAYVSQGDQAFAETIHFADSSFFQLFPLHLKSGTYQNFGSQYSIFLSERLAKKYFGEVDPMGHTLTVELNNQTYEVSVGGVLEKTPINSTFIPDALMRTEPYLQAYHIGIDNWSEGREASLLIELTDLAQRENIGRQMQRYISLRNQAKPDSKVLSYELIPFGKAFSPNDVRQSYLHLIIPFKALFIFATLASIILLIACFNLTNTTLALTGKRWKEMGLRRVVGSSRWQIANQLLLEMGLTIMIAILAGLVLAQWIVPEFSAMWGLPYGLGDLNGVYFLVALIVLLFVSALLAGLYPALRNSRFSPLALLRRDIRIKGTSPVTRLFLVAQFSLSILFLVAGIVFTQNASYQQHIGFGYNKENLLIVSLQGGQQYERLKNALQQNPAIEKIAGTTQHFGYLNSYAATLQMDATRFESNVYEVGAHYFDVMGLNLVRGRDFRENSPLDQESAAIVDENFVRKYRLNRPIGTQIRVGPRAYRVVGIVKNHLNSLLDKSSLHKDHMYLMARPEQYRVLIARTDKANMQQVVEDQWKKNFPGKPFESEWQEDVVLRGANEYNRNLQQTFLFLTVLGVLMSASGIYSLASLNVQRRTKEIGIRKVLGASLTNLVQLVNREFALLLLLAVSLGGLAGYFVTGALLNDLYVQHIGVDSAVAMLCGMAVFCIGIATTSLTILRVAQANPVRTLKVE